MGSTGMISTDPPGKAQLCVPSVSALRGLDRLQRPRRGGGPDGCGIPKKMWVCDKVGRRGEFTGLVSAFPHKAQKVDALAHLGRALKARLFVENASDREPFPIASEWWLNVIRAQCDVKHIIAIATVRKRAKIHEEHLESVSRLPKFMRSPVTLALLANPPYRLECLVCDGVC
jgi:hypothetical protein